MPGRGRTNPSYSTRRWCWEEQVAERCRDCSGFARICSPTSDPVGKRATHVICSAVSWVGANSRAAIAEQTRCWPLTLAVALEGALAKWAGASVRSCFSVSSPVRRPVAAGLGCHSETVPALSPFHLALLAQLHLHTKYHSCQTLPRGLFLLPQREAGLAVVHICFLLRSTLRPPRSLCH